SNQDRNFLLTDAGGARRLLKFANPAFGPLELEAQGHAAVAVSAAGLRAPRVVPALDGTGISTVEVDGQRLQARLLEFIDGVPLSEHGEFTAVDARRLGTLAGRVVAALAPLAHEGFEQRTQWNLRDGVRCVELLAPSIPDQDR